ncbi:MAG TPA: acyloxyacyl hydrolase [Chitinophagaceae bacterium]|nr:PorT family protein [Chitinophagaceae bacterium]MCB9056321.1 PorT family protein [Chitinophagales bacterium]HPG11773.1 acyloxyacyl hydrolase [Chitinophagaceae bacterium]
MKKLLLVLVAGLLVTSSFAQIDREDGDSKKKKKCEDPFYGFLGIGLSSINGDSDSYDKPLIGGYLGIGFCLTQFNQNVGLRTELAYAIKGSKWSEMYGDGNVRLGYVALPVFVRATSNSGFYGEAGGEIAALTSAKDNYDGESYDFKDEVNNIDFGALFGLGYQFGRFGVGARVVQGLTNINKQESDQYKDHNFAGNVRFTVNF